MFPGQKVKKLQRESVESSVTKVAVQHDVHLVAHGEERPSEDEAAGAAWANSVPAEAGTESDRPISPQAGGESRITWSQPSVLSDGSEATAESVDLTDYRIGDLLGQGGMGSVFRAHHRSIDKTVAVKFLRRELASDPVSMARFRQEVKAASMLTHVNLAAVYDSGVGNDGIPYMVMDYLNGETLDATFTREGFLALERFLDIFIQVTEALVHAHSKGVVHRDVKPSNIMLLDSDLVKVVDFGIARVLQQAAESTQHQFTQTGAVLGSPTYMSPEQCLSKAIDEKSDIYSLGAVMYHALTGSPPFTGENPVEIIVQHVHDRPRLISRLRPDLRLPGELEELVMKALEKSPAKRPNSAQQVLDRLLVIRDWHQGTKTRPLISAVRRTAAAFVHNRAIALVACVVLVGVLYLAYAMIGGRSRQHSETNAANFAQENSTRSTSPGMPAPAKPPPGTRSGPKPAKGFVITDVRGSMLYASEKATTLQETLKEACDKHVPLHNAALYGAHIRNVDLSGIDLSDADLRVVTLDNVNLSGARLGHADFNAGHLSSVQMRDADLSSASLTNLYVTHSNFDRANLRMTMIDSTSFVNCTFQNAQFYCVNGQQCQFRNCNLNGTVMDRCEFGVLDGCTFLSSTLTKADFSRAFQVTACDFTNAKVSLKSKPALFSRDNNINDGFLDTGTPNANIQKGKSTR